MSAFCFTEEEVLEFGPIEPPKEAVRDVPYSLPGNYEWSVVDILNVEQVGRWLVWDSGYSPFMLDVFVL